MTARRNLLSAALALASVACASQVFVIHRIESRGPVIKQVSTTRFFSPDGDGNQDVMFTKFRMRNVDFPRLMVLDEHGEVIARARRTRKSNDHMVATFVWNGKTSKGSIVNDGVYHLRVRLPKANRTLTLPSNVIVDVKPPDLLVKEADYSRLTTMSIVRVTIVVERSTDQRVEINGKSLSQVRSVKLGVSDDGRLVTRRISVRVNEIEGDLAVIAEDRAGNTSKKVVSRDE